MTEKEFGELWESLVDRFNGEKPIPFTREERLFYAVNLLRGSVPRSGFQGYFENFRGPDISDAHEGLKELNLPTVLSLLQQAQKIVLGDRPLPADSSPIEVLQHSLSEKEYEEASDRIDSELTPIEKMFYNSEDDIWKALCRFAKEKQLGQST